MAQFVNGNIEHPYSREQYESLFRSGDWSSGWVIMGRYCYINNNGVIINEKGTSEYPFNYSDYLMCYEAGSWYGGYVANENGSVEYMSSHLVDDDNGGCGCGSGCGSYGGGGAIVAGSESIMRSLSVGTFRCIVSWGDGQFGALFPTPSLSISDATLTYNTSHNYGISFVASWALPYVVRITFSVINGHTGGSISVDYSIPEYYRRNSNG
ncbi:MAG: hypothetical protein HUK03_06625 [Bacteroidaceae bacterium]|nr:hypothetical protein [Bacteroidaceae bacterium]